MPALMITTNDVARLLNRRPLTISRMRDQRGLPHQVLTHGRGRLIMFDLRKVLKWAVGAQVQIDLDVARDLYLQHTFDGTTPRAEAERAAAAFVADFSKGKAPAPSNA